MPPEFEPIMNHRLLVVSEDDSAVESMLAKLNGMDLVIEQSSSFGAAIRNLGASGRPDSVLIAKSLSTPGVLELIAALDEEPPTIPVIVLDDEPLLVPVKLSPELIWHHHQSSGTLPGSIASAFGSPANVRSVRWPVDYLVCAMACLRSVGLQIGLKNGADCLFEFVGGDLWNVYSDGAEGLEALAEVVYEPVSNAEVRKLQMIPGERQIYQTGVRPLAPESMKGVATEEEEFSTNEFPVKPVIDELKAAGHWPVTGNRGGGDSRSPTTGSTAKPAETVGADSADPFDDILTRGIKASLSRNYTLAAELFRQALDLRPDDPKAKFNLQQVQKRLKS